MLCPRPLPLSYLGGSIDDLFSLLLYNTFKARDLYLVVYVFGNLTAVSSFTITHLVLTENMLH